MEEREKEVIKSFEKDADKKDAFEKVMQDVRGYAESCVAKLKELRVGEEGIVFRFHAGTDASIPHLHMHVLASPVEFRQYSTLVHNRKAIPAEIVMEVIDAERKSASKSAGLMNPRTEISAGQAG
ncbi:hypothetical protein D9758_009986 [Tetrapyrgos nigripes]|uniref:HIT domain-containing protein n=1 Tax=Tetrapyrgos nigripes TaxID=182062 RepID=A0A8H5CR83_9AGAR|nr:hypothetical protein D9758_009986 [Tetrapyrgos nigripes]